MGDLKKSEECPYMGSFTVIKKTIFSYLKFTRLSSSSKIVFDFSILIDEYSKIK
jgi:hypothetical protein